MDTLERELFDGSVRAVLERHTGPALERALVELGWFEALRNEPHVAISSLFGLQGSLNVTSPLDAVLATALGLEDTQPAVVLPSFGRHEAAGEQRGDEVAVRGIGTRRLTGATQAVVAVVVDERVELMTVAPAELELRPVKGIDPDLELVEVGGTIAARPLGEPVPVPADRWPAALALARLALSHELLGAARAMLQLACGHATERIQFGRPIASFQAVRHRLADALVTIEAGEATLDDAWEAGTHFRASVAKAAAGRSALIVAGHAQQVLAGTGFTAEHPLHRFVKRALALDQLLGSATSLTRSIGDELLAARALPPDLPL